CHMIAIIRTLSGGVSYEDGCLSNRSSSAASRVEGNVRPRTFVKIVLSSSARIPRSLEQTMKTLVLAIVVGFTLISVDAVAQQGPATNTTPSGTDVATLPIPAPVAG